MPRYRHHTVGDVRNQAAGKKRPPDPLRTEDPACAQALQTREDGRPITAFERYAAQAPQCSFGLTGTCCRICIQGPCRVMPKKEESTKGICGASDYTIVGRNTVRYIAGGASCHSDHGRHAASTLLKIAEGEAPDYKVSDPDKLHAIAERHGIEWQGRDDLDVAREVALLALNDYGRIDDEPCEFLWKTISDGRRAKFVHCDIVPSSIDRTIVELITQTAMGMDADPVNIIFGGLKTSLADYTGMHIATDLSDVIFGTPSPVKTRSNLGVIDPEKVNVAAHGHNPLLSEMIVEAASDLEEEARKAGAKGINVVGICCTGNELIMRRGVPLAGNQHSQEAAILTGALDAMIVDIQCIMPAIAPLAQCFNTRVITTSRIVKIPGSYHFDFEEKNALDTARAMLRLAIDAFKERKGRPTSVPDESCESMAGFSFEAIEEILGAVNPERPFKVLTDAILDGTLKGVCLLAGCNNLRAPHDRNHIVIMKELARHDVLMVATGCSAGAACKMGLATPEAVDEYGGDGLKRFMKMLEEAGGIEDGLPLVWHMGSCVDNSRAADLWTAMANELGVDVPKVPFVASAPEAMHEKAMSIGSWVVTMGIPCHVGVMPPVEGSALIYGLTTQIAHDVYGGHFMFEEDPERAAEMLVDALEYRTWKLRIHAEAAERYGTEPAVNW